MTTETTERVEIPPRLDLGRHDADGCAYCLGMHTIDAEAHGEAHQPMHALPARCETP